MAGLLAGIQAISKSNSNRSIGSNTAEVLAGCLQVLQTVSDRLEKCDPTSHPGHLQHFRNRIRRPLGKAETMEFVTVVERHKVLSVLLWALLPCMDDPLKHSY